MSRFGKLCIWTSGSELGQIKNLEARGKTSAAAEKRSVVRRKTLKKKTLKKEEEAVQCAPNKVPITR
jgi:hypothetical protein